MKEQIKRAGVKRWFRLCPVRHVLTLMGLVLLAVYFLLRGNAGAMRWIYSHVTAPLHRVLSGLCSHVRFSVAEAVIVLFVLLVLGYIVWAVVRMVRTRRVPAGLYRIGMTAVMLFAVIYGGFCILWGVYYEVSSFEAESGIQRELVQTDHLEAVTRYFAGLCNQYGQQVSRDENGLFNEPLDAIFDRSETLYDSVQQEFPCLQGADLRAKPVHFSRIMSYTQFTGFFFPFTAEANINVDSPACLVPSTIAHEIAHQRGVAAEDEANFVAVLSSLSSGDTVYSYSASLLAYIYLGNALYKADREAWSAVYSSLSDEVRADLNNNNTYWDQFETPAAQVSDTVYNSFLQSYGQEQGLKTYGACVDLLVAYYYETAVQ